MEINQDPSLSKEKLDYQKYKFNFCYFGTSKSRLSEQT